MSTFDIKSALQDTMSFQRFVDAVTLVNLEEELELCQNTIDRLSTKDKKSLKGFEKEDLANATKVRDAIIIVMNYMAPFTEI